MSAPNSPTARTGKNRPNGRRLLLRVIYCGGRASTSGPGRSARPTATAVCRCTSSKAAKAGRPVPVRIGSVQGAVWEHADPDCGADDPGGRISSWGCSASPSGCDKVWDPGDDHSPSSQRLTRYRPTSPAYSAPARTRPVRLSGSRSTTGLPSWPLDKSELSSGDRQARWLDVAGHRGEVPTGGRIRTYGQERLAP